MIHNFKQHIAQAYYLEDMNNRDDELAKVQELRNNYVSERDRLTEKLSDENNYQFSFFATEAYDQERKRLESSIDDSKTRIKEITSKNSEIDNNIVEIKETIKDLKDQRSQIQADYRANSDFEEADKDYQEGLEAIEKEETRLKKQLEDLMEQKADNKSDLKKETKNIKDKTFSLGKEKYKDTTINKFAMKVDQVKLDEYNRLIHNLDVKTDYLSHDVEEDLNSLINGLTNQTTYEYETNDGKIIKENLVIPEDLVDSTIPVDPNEIIESTGVVETEDIDLDEPTNDSVTFDELLKGSHSELEEEPVEDVKKDKKKPIPIVIWSKAKKSLIDKVRNSEFLQNFKKFIKERYKVILITAALGAGLVAGVASCSKQPEPVPVTEIVEETPEIEAPEIEEEEPVVTKPVYQAPTPTPTPAPAPTPTPTPVPTPIVEEPTVKLPDDKLEELPKEEEKKEEEEKPVIPPKNDSESEPIIEVKPDLTYTIANDDDHHEVFGGLNKNDVVEIVGGDYESNEIFSTQLDQWGIKNEIVPNGEEELVQKVEYNDTDTPTIDVGISDNKDLPGETLVEKIEEAAGVKLENDGSEEAQRHLQEEEDMRRVMAELGLDMPEEDLGGKTK